MIIVREVTEWSVPVANNIYVLNDSMTKIMAYVPEGSNQVKKFKQPIDFDRRDRKFEELPSEGETKPVEDRWEFQGSKGEVYYVTREPGGGLNYQCTCPGFTYRGSCKHVAEKIMEHSYDVR